MLSLLPWLLHGRQRPEYAPLQAQLAEHGGAVVFDSAPVGKLLLAVIACRFAFNALLREPTQRLAERRGKDAHHKDGRRLLEEGWVLLGNTLMLGAAMFVVLRRNGGCTFLDTRACLAGWPNLAADPAVTAYYQLELAWYLHMLLKPVLRYGLPDGRDMVIHHCASLALILVSYGANLTRIGTVVLAVFAMSNPLLHAAKICNQLSLGPLKIGGFLVFAAVFFVSRVLLVPWAVLKPALLDSRTVIPYVLADFPAIYWGVNALLALLYVLQLMWMHGIVRVIRQALTHGADAASKMSAQIDPAKRYAVQADALAPAGSSSGNSGSVAAGNGGTGGSSKARSPPATPSTAVDSPAVVSPPVGRRTWLAEGVGENNKVK